MAAGVAKSGLGVVTYTDSRRKIVEQKPLGTKPQGTSKKTGALKGKKDDEKVHQPALTNDAKVLAKKQGTHYDPKHIRKQPPAGKGPTVAQLQAQSATTKKEKAAASALADKMLSSGTESDDAFKKRETMSATGTPSEKRIATLALGKLSAKEEERVQKWAAEWEKGLSNKDPKVVSATKEKIENSSTAKDNRMTQATMRALERIPSKVLFSDTEREIAQNAFGGKKLDVPFGLQLIDTLNDGKSSYPSFDRRRGIILAERMGEEMATHPDLFSVNDDRRDKAHTQIESIPQKLPSAWMTKSFKKAYEGSFAYDDEAATNYLPKGQKEIAGLDATRTVASLGKDLVQGVNTPVSDDAGQIRLAEEKNKVRQLENILSSPSSSDGERKVASTLLMMVHHNSQKSPLSEDTKLALGIRDKKSALARS